MGTSNFYKRNTDHYYVFNDDQLNDDYYYFIHNLYEKFDSLGYTTYNSVQVDRIEEHIIIAERTEYVQFSNDFMFYITTIITLKSGYYSGACYDFVINTEIDSGINNNDILLEDFDQEIYNVYYDEIYDLIYDYFVNNELEINEGLIKSHTNLFIKKICKRMESLSNKINKDLEDNCDHILGVAARFSNGETMYTELK